MRRSDHSSRGVIPVCVSVCLCLSVCVYVCVCVIEEPQRGGLGPYLGCCATGAEVRMFFEDDVFSFNVCQTA